MTSLGSSKTGCLKLLALSQPETPGQEALSLALEEVNKVDATVDRVSGELASCSWLHFSRHGMQNSGPGVNSAFALQGGDLKLSQIAFKRSTQDLPYLSACHTGVCLQELRLPGEAMDHAGGLQFAGFPSVIATMWGVSDKDCTIVASHTYEYLFRNGL